MSRLLLLLLHQGGNASTAMNDAGVSPSKRGRTTEDDAQGLDGKKRRIDPVAARMRESTVGGRAGKQKQAPTPSRTSTRLNKMVPTGAGISSTRLSPRASLSNTGDPIVLEDMRKYTKKLKKTVSRPTKAANKYPLERIHSKLATSSNVDIHVPPANKPAAAAQNAAASSDAPEHPFVPAIEVHTNSGTIGISEARLYGSDETVSARNAEVVPTLLSMRGDEVSPPDLIFSKEDSRSSDSANQFMRNPSEPQERHPMDFTPPSCTLGIDRSQDEPPIDPIPIAFAFPGGMAPTMAQPILDGRKAVKFADPIVQATPEEISPSLEAAFRRIEQDAIYKRSLRNQGKSRSADPTDLVHDDAIRSTIPGSVKQARVVHAPVADDCQLELRATREQTGLFDIVKHLGNARASSKHMKQLKETKIIQCESTYLDLGDLAESVRPTGKMSLNVAACGIDYIKNHMDICVDKTIMSYSVTCKIWDGDFHHSIIRKKFAAHGDLKLTLKHFVIFPMFQFLELENPVDKCGHHYTICLDLKHQRFEVLDSLRSGDDTSLTSHTEFFVNNLKETWNRHYENSKVQIGYFPIEYVLTDKQGNGYDCGFYMLEYLAKWEGRKVPAISKASVVELRKILTWNWVTNGDFNKRPSAREFIDEAVKTACRKYK